MEGRGGAAWLGTWISLFSCAAWMTLVTGNQLHFLYVSNGNETKSIQHSGDKQFSLKTGSGSIQVVNKSEMRQS